MAIDKEQAALQQRPRTSVPIVTPGARMDATPRRTPARFGL
jgi:hypothetical protein